jgi:hypothetical protein
VPATDEAMLEETRLLRLAHGALRRGAPSEALGYLRDHERRFPSGTLAPERDAARLLALCQLGPTDRLRRRAERLFARNPGTVHAARIRAACGLDAPSAGEAP